MLTLVPDAGSFRGGGLVQVIGDNLDMTSCSDDFADGTVGSLWSVTTTGSGAVTEDAVARALILDTGSTPSSVAGVRTVAQMLDVDVEARFTIRNDVRPTNDRVTHAELGLTDVAGLFALRAAILLDGARTLRITRGTVTLVERIIATDAEIGATHTLRLLRAGPLVIVFLNGDPVVRVAHGSAAALFIEMRVLNAAVTSRVVTAVSNYARRPVLAFAGEPMADLTSRSTTRATGHAPPGACTGGPVDVTIAGCTGIPTTAAGAFTYVIDDALALSRELTVCNDARLGGA